MQKILVIFLVLIAGNVISENTIIAIVNDIPISLNSIETNFLNTNSNEEKIEILNTQIDVILQLEKVSEFNLKPTIEDVELVLKDVAKKNNLSISDLLNLEEINSIKHEIEEKLGIYKEGIKEGVDEKIASIKNSKDEFVRKQERSKVKEVIAFVHNRATSITYSVFLLGFVLVFSLLFIFIVS